MYHLSGCSKVRDFGACLNYACVSDFPFIHPRNMPFNFKMDRTQQNKMSF